MLPEHSSDYKYLRFLWEGTPPNLTALRNGWKDTYQVEDEIWARVDFLMPPGEFLQGMEDAPGWDVLGNTFMGVSV